MKNSNKALMALASILFLMSRESRAAEFLIFDFPGMLMLKENGALTGYYGAVDRDKNCDFFFFAKKDLQKEKGSDYLVDQISSFSFGYPSKTYKYKDRDARFDSPGEIYNLQNQWVVRINSPAPGCVGWAVGSFGRKPEDQDATRYTVENKVEAIGMGVITRKSFFYEKINFNFIKQRGYLVAGDVLVVLTTYGNYSYVRYANPDFSAEGRVTTGWVRSADLVDPFPPAKH